MKTHPLNSAKGYFTLGLIVIWVASGSLMSYAHSGAVMAPTVVAGSINVADANIEGAWGAGIPSGLLANDCTDFFAMSGATVTAYAANDGTNLFVAFDIPDQSANAADALFLFFDPTPSVAGGGTATAADDRAFRFPFGDASGAAIDLSATASNFTGAGGPNNWSAAAAGLPAGVQAFYRRDTGANKYQFEARFPFSALPGITNGSGFAFVYMNRTNLPVSPPPGGDCFSAGVLTDFYVKSPGIPTFGLSAQLPRDVGNPSQWQDLQFGAPPPTVAFQPPLCCGSTDIDFSPAAQPFTPGMPVNIRAKPHNLSAATPANNVNVEIRVHNFGTGGGGSVVFTSGPPGGMNSAQVPTIAASSAAFTNFVVWADPPAGLHGCIRAEIKPATVSPYLIAPGSEVAQHNIDVAGVGKGMKKALAFNVFNPDQRQEGLKIMLIKQEQLPAGGGGLHFDLEQPARPLRPQEEMPVHLTVTVDADAPLTDVSATKATVPPTAGGANRGPVGAIPAEGVPGEQVRLAAFAQAAPGNTDAVTVDVKPGERLYLAATGEVDLDGAGPLPAAPPDGKDFSAEMREGQFLLTAQGANRVAGALLGSFDNFQHGFVIGSEGTVTVPEKVDKLFLAVNDIIGRYGDNTGSGFAVSIGRLPTLIAPAAKAVAIPQVNITAVATSDVSVAGTQIVYHVGANLGGVTYQVLVTEGAAGGGGTGTLGRDKKWLYYLLIILLILLLLFFIIRWLTRRRHA